MTDGSGETLNPDNLNFKTPVTITNSPSFVNLGTPTVQARADLLSTGSVYEEATSPVRSLPILNDIMNCIDDQCHHVAVVANVAESEPSKETKILVQKLKPRRLHG